LFNPADDSDQSDTEEDTDVEDTLPPAFEEHPSIRNAYIRTFAMHAFSGITKVVVRDQLVMVAALAAGIDNQTQGLGNVARTLTTLKRCLGIRTSHFIKYCFICDRCWYRHEPGDLYELLSPQCTRQGCEGTLYKITQAADSSCKPPIPEKHVPVKAPCSPLSLSPSPPPPSLPRPSPLSLGLLRARVGGESTVNVDLTLALTKID